MASTECRVGDVGFIVRATLKDAGVAVDISGATTKQLIFRRPDGTKKTVAAAFTNTGTDGKLQYTVPDNGAAAPFLDQPGKWTFQAYVVLAAWAGKSTIGHFDVLDNL